MINNKNKKDKMINKLRIETMEIFRKTEEFEEKEIIIIEEEIYINTIINTNKINIKMNLEINWNNKLFQEEYMIESIKKYIKMI
jgi:hypothetical protein